MPSNLGSYLGLAKEAIYGTPVAPAFFLAISNPADVHAEVPLQDVPNTTALGPLATEPGIRHGVFNAQAAADPAGIGALLSALFGAPVTTGTAAPYAHAFTPKNAQSGFTFEALDRVAKHVLAGGKTNQARLSHTPDGYLQASFDGIGQDKTEPAGAASVVTLPTQFFTQRQLVVTVDGVNVSALSESVDVTLNMPKAGLVGFGQAMVAGVEPTGEGDASVAITLRDDGVDRFTPFLAATPKVVDLKWTISADYSLEVNFPYAVLTADPKLRSNTDLGIARVALNYRALSQGTDMVTVTLINHQDGTLY